MSDEPRDTDDAPSDEPRRRDHLRVVAEPEVIAGGPAPRPRSIGRVIAQTALIADSAVTRRRETPPPSQDGRGVARLLGRFR